MCPSSQADQGNVSTVAQVDFVNTCLIIRRHIQISISYHRIPAAGRITGILPEASHRHQIECRTSFSVLTDMKPSSIKKTDTEMSGYSEGIVLVRMILPHWEFSVQRTKFYLSSRCEEVDAPLVRTFISPVSIVYKNVCNYL